ncbi:DUF4304 domain-containing protein [Pseudorhodobacter ferrugineus]|uniref:DUF4304 domain-containing protein n=1 Tax=Pseudorhodobacter ferrugineus TaxID=77008 RepID=UPI000B30781C|nr:DUF4304 domain-containing protein [Pseudorhodobacter ferrugineus]
MPLPRWLRAFLPKPVSPTPPVPARDVHVLAASTAACEQARADLQPSRDFIDTGVRMHIAAHDPEFPNKREAAVKTILAAIDTVAQTHGFTKKAKSWAKTGNLGIVSIHLQRSRYGFESYVNLGFQPLDEAPHGPWAQDDFVRLARFYPPSAPQSGEAGTLTYLDVFDDPSALDQPMEILSERALPWLVAHLTNPTAHSLPFLQGQAALPNDISD